MREDRKGGMSVLIAEDDLICSKILEKNLQNWGYEVIIARSGEKAWQALRDESLRMAILDWMMPGMAGTEICSRVRRRRKYKYTYVILLSARDRKQDIITGLSSGADDYMTKPVNFLELKARLQTGRRIIDLEDKLLLTQRQLKELASRDSLTKLWNRAETDKFLDEELDRGRREGTPVGVIMIDIDHFKKINDQLGHEHGDAALLQVVSWIKRKVRKSDRVGRYGGDEIIVILPNCGSAKIGVIAERLRAAVAEHPAQQGPEVVRVTISAGCATTECLTEPTVEKLIRQADAGLLAAKARGRDCVVSNGPDRKLRKE